MSRRTRRPGQAGHTDSENRVCLFGSFKVAFREPRAEQDQSQCSGIQCLLWSRAPFDERTRAYAPGSESLRGSMGWAAAGRRNVSLRHHSRRPLAPAARPRHVARRVPPHDRRTSALTVSLEHLDSKSPQASSDDARRSSCRRGRPPGGGSTAARKLAGPKPGGHGRPPRAAGAHSAEHSSRDGEAQIDRKAGAGVPAGSPPHPPRRLSSC